MKQPVFVAALAASLAIAGAALAQPQGGGGVRAACQADFQKLCPDAKPGPGGTLRACIRDHQAQLSDGCKSALAAMRAARQAAGGGAAPAGQ